MTRRVYDPNIVSRRIKELRKEINITQIELSEKTQIPIDSIRCYESNSVKKRRIPDQTNLKALAKIFKVETDYILGVSNYRSFADMFDKTEDPLIKDVRKHESQLFDYCDWIGCKFVDLVEAKGFNGFNQDGENTLEAEILADQFIKSINESIRIIFNDLMKGSTENEDK